MSLGVMLREEQIASPTPLTRSAFRLRSFQREIQNLSLFPRLMCPGQNIYLGKRVFSLCELTCFRPWVMSNWYLNPFPLILNFLYMHFCCYLFVYLLGRMDRTNAACFPRKSLTVAKSTPLRFRTRTEPREPGSCVGAAHACAVPSTPTCPGHPEPLGLWEPRLPQLCQQPLLSCASAAGYSWYGVEKVVGARPVGGHTERLWESSSRMFLLSGLSGLAGGMADFRAFRWDVASGCRETGNSCFEAVWTLTSPCVLHKPLLVANSIPTRPGPGDHPGIAWTPSPAAPDVHLAWDHLPQARALLAAAQGLPLPARPSVRRGWGSLKESYRQAPCGDQEPAWQSLCC